MALSGGSFKSNRAEMPNVHETESSTEDEESESDISEEPKSSTLRRTTQSEKSAKLSAFDLSKLESRTSFAKQIGRNLAQLAINSSYDRLKSVNFLIPGPSGSGQATKRPGSKGDPSTDPRLRTVSCAK
jgi:hypothetical protein